jgi:hypothetical protein
MVVREGRGGEREREFFGTAASNVSIVPTHHDRLHSVMELVTGKEKSKWQEKTLPQYHNINANYPGIESERGEKQQTNLYYGINSPKY